MRNSKKNEKNEFEQKYNVLEKEYEKEIKDSRDRLFSLREENRILKEQLEDFKTNEKYIAGVMLSAKKAAEQIIADAEFEANKKIFSVQEEERQLQTLISRYTNELVEIQKITSGLLHDIVERVSQLSHNEIVEVIDIPLPKESYNNIRKIMEQSEAKTAI